MPYAYITLATLRTALAARLQDPAFTFWLSTELDVYIREALRTWNAMAAWYRDRMVFNTTPSVPFYDIATVPNSLVPRTVTDLSLFQEIEYHLLEPPTPGTWTGSEQFNAADITQALQRRRDQFLLETGAVLLHESSVSGSLLTGRFDLDDTTIDVRRAAYLDANGNYTTLDRSDEYELSAFAPGWSANPDFPSYFSVMTTPPVRVQVAPLPNIAGVLDLVTINTGAALDPTVPTILGVPDDYAWVIKWGALADLLTKDGPPSDPFRANYCQQRWSEGIMLTRVAASALFAQLDGLDTHIESLRDLDTNVLNWQNIAPGPPLVIAMAGLNLLILEPVPDANPHSVTLDVIRNMPVPLVDADQIQVGREELDVILDYSEHLASFKMSGAEFQATQPAYQRMVQLAMQQNERWRAAAKAASDLHDRETRDFSQFRRRAHPEVVQIGSDMTGGI